MNQPSIEEYKNTGQAPLLPNSPEQIEYDATEQKKIAETICRLYDERTRERKTREEDHLKYDQMFRGKIKEFRPRQGPWEGSANIHVPMPYWLVDSIEARLNHLIWSQNPLVVGTWETPSDKEKAEKSARLVEWDLQPSRMNARANWSRASKIRLVHGHSASLIFYANVDHIFRVRVPNANPEDYKFHNGLPEVDAETGEPVKVPTEEQTKYVKDTLYSGPVIYPFEWSDVVAPEGCMNYQPNRANNPGGADYVFMLQGEYLSLMKQKEKDGLYYEMFSGGRNEKWWEDRAPTAPQGQRGTEHDRRRAQEQRMQGDTPQGQHVRKNPVIEVLMCWLPWEHPELGVQEMLFFVSYQPRVFLGGYLLSDVVHTGVRPILEMHYQTVSNHINSMGVCEIIEYLSDELDTIHNLRLDVGFATNMPWYFVRNTSGLKGSQITIKPLALIPVDNPHDVVAPQTQSVYQFYHQEESLTLTIVERVMGVADMFLGVNPTGGAAARHATGFMGTQQESVARMANPIAQDAESFSFMCRVIRDLEVQYGPPERKFRLSGQADDAVHVVSRDDLWYSGSYDYRLGANVGMYSQQFRHQRAMGEYQTFSPNPLVAQDMTRLWHLSAEVLRSSGRSQGEIELILGPVSALPNGEPKSPSQAINEIVEGKYGPQGFPIPHPSDDNAAHIQKVMEFIQSDAYIAMGRPNFDGMMNYLGAQQRAMQMKTQQQMAQQAQTMMGQGGGQPGGPGASTEARVAGQLNGVMGGGGQPQTGSAFGDAMVSGAGANPASMPPPFSGQGANGRAGGQ